MKIEKSEMENKIILLYRLRCRWKLKSYKKKKVWQQKQIFLVTILFKKVREEKGGVGGWGYPSVAAYSRKNIPSNGEMINLIFHGLSYITRRNFAHCSKLSCFLPHSEKYRATCKISARVIF